MPDFKQIAKNGWNSEKTGVIRNKVDAALGRESSHRDVSNYSATPLDQLRDPSTFAPPPKRLNSGVLPPPQLPPASSSSSTASPTSPAGGAHAHAQYGGGHAQQQGLLPEAAAAPPPAPPRPYRVDTTGLSTAHLPPPPGRRDAADGSRSSSSPPPPPYSVTATPGSRPAPPSLPPRLPPRANSASPAASSPAGPPGYLNQGAVDRLGGAGVSVPGLGIGGSGGGDRPVLPPPPPSRSSAASPSSLSRPDASPTASGGGSMSEMRSRFSKFKDGLGGTTSPSSSPAPAQSSQGTTWTQKQAALKTMSDFKKDPKSVSYSSVRSAASTANNFRERHGEQVAAGVTKAKGMNEKYGVSEKAKGMNEKYGVSEKVGGYMGRGNGGSSAEPGRVASPAQSHLNSMSTAVGGLMGKKKPPPPPPKKKPGLGGSTSGGGGGGEDAPPPVPLSTRPV